jgi:predicted branched-subunit amino acid permease
MTDGVLPPSRSDRLTQIATVAAVNAVVGATVAATAVSYGMSRPMAIAMTAGMFSGAAQYAAMSTYAAAGGLTAILLAAMLINARFLLLGASLAPQIDATRRQRLAMAVLLVDPIVVIAQREGDPARIRRTFAVGGAVTLASWGVGSVVGALGAAMVTDPAAVGLDVALPALLLAVVAGGARTSDSRLAAISGAGIAVLLLAQGVGSSTVVLVSALGCAVPFAVRAGRRRLDEGRPTAGGAR